MSTEVEIEPTAADGAAAPRRRRRWLAALAVLVVGVVAIVGVSTAVVSAQWQDRNQRLLSATIERAQAELQRQAALPVAQQNVDTFEQVVAIDLGEQYSVNKSFTQTVLLGRAEPVATFGVSTYWGGGPFGLGRVEDDVLLAARIDADGQPHVCVIRDSFDATVPDVSAPVMLLPQTTFPPCDLAMLKALNRPA